MCIRKYVIIIPDGAADNSRIRGVSPLRAAKIPHMDFIATAGICGLMQTLYADLPRESMVAQMGLLGWDPRLYYPGGRASSELLALGRVTLNSNDLAFRANFVSMSGTVLTTYNAHFIRSKEARILVRKLRSHLSGMFPEFELYHLSDFRTSLVFRNAGIDPGFLKCPEPHENHGQSFDLVQLVTGHTARGRAIANRLNEYVAAAASVLKDSRANALFPWSPARPLVLPTFSEVTGIEGRAAIVGFMDFLKGIAIAGKIQFFRMGNGRPDTDYCGKGEKILDLLRNGYECVICHINAPDEASHMTDALLKVQCLEKIDKFIVAPVVRYFRSRINELGGVVIVPDHYSNTNGSTIGRKRSDIHSLEPVPFAFWSAAEHDGCMSFDESAARDGKFGRENLTHLDLFSLLRERTTKRGSARRA